jgi:hypothetical protein
VDKENFRFYIKVRTALNIQPIIIHDEYVLFSTMKLLLLGLLQRWSKWFYEGREEIDDKTRPGRPITETRSENIEQVHSIINDDPYITVEELQAQTDLSHFEHLMK